MAEIAEGFTISATITLNVYDDLKVLGELKLPKIKITEQQSDHNVNLVLDKKQPSEYLGDIFRSNTGTQGFTLNATCTSDTVDTTEYIGDVKHGKIKISEQSGDTNANLTLNASDNTEYLGDILRSNIGTQGFTLKATATLNTLGSTAVVGDIKHGVAIDSEQTRDVMADIVLDNMAAMDYLGDVLRANTGKQGFTVNANAYLDAYSEQEVIGDMYRSVGGTLWDRLGVVAYKGKFYFTFNKDKFQDILLLEDEDIKDGDDNIDG